MQTVLTLEAKITLRELNSDTQDGHLEKEGGDFTYLAIILASRIKLIREHVTYWCRHSNSYSS